MSPRLELPSVDTSPHTGLQAKHPGDEADVDPGVVQELSLVGAGDRFDGVTERLAAASDLQRGLADLAVDVVAER